MKRFFRWSKDTVTMTSVFSIFVFLLFLYVMMMQVVFPGIEQAVYPYPVFDKMVTGYHLTDVQLVLSALSNVSRNLYLYIFLPLNSLVPLVAAFLASILISKAARRYHGWYYLLPCVYLLIEWLENLCIYHYLSSAEISPAVVLMGSVLGILKGIVSGILLPVILGFCLAVIFVTYIKKNSRRQTFG